MRYRRAVEKLRILASACDLQRAWPGQEPPLLLAAYAFGEHRGHLYDASEADPGGAGDGPVPFRRAEA